MTSAKRELQNEKILPIVGFEPGTFRSRGERAKRWPIWDDKYRSPNGDRNLPQNTVNSCPYRVVNVVNVLSSNAMKKKTFTVSKRQTAKRYKYHMRKIHDKPLLYQPRIKGKLHRKLRENAVTFRWSILISSNSSMLNADQTECWIVFCMLKANTWLVRLFAICTI